MDPESSWLPWHVRMWMQWRGLLQTILLVVVLGCVGVLIGGVVVTMALDSVAMR